MAKTDWQVDDTVKPEDLNQIGQEINGLQADGNVTTPRLANKAVTKAKLADDVTIGGADDTMIGDRTINDATTPISNIGKLTSLLSGLANMIKSITGGATWRTAPGMTIAAIKTILDAATNLATASTLIKRDANGRAKVAAPSAADDIARKTEVDAAISTAAIDATAKANAAQSAAISAAATDATSKANAVQANLTTHAADAVKHITAAERTAWNAKETPAAAQSKADTAQSAAISAAATDAASKANAVQTNLTTHINDSVKHITAAERTAWNAKASTAVATTSASGLMSTSDKAKLDGIAAGANNYVHPTGAGNNHIPAGGAAGNVLRWNAAGAASWGKVAWSEITEVPSTFNPSSHDHARVQRVDSRARKPVDTAKGFSEFVFTSLGGMTGSQNSEYQDMIVLNTYTDTSGGKVNALVFDKATTTIRHYQADQGATTWGTPKVLSYTDHSHSDATTSAAGFMTAAMVTKLNGIATGANNYVHPSTHPPSIIAQDASNRFVTDAEKSTWNAKASTAVATTSANGLMAAADKTKLNGIAVGAQVNPGAATTSAAGLMSAADKTKLDGIAAGAQVNRAIATQAQAIAGTDNTTDMTSLRVREAIDARTRYGTTAGSATVFTLTLSPAPASLYTGLQVTVKLHANTGTNPALNVNGLGAKALYDGDGTRFSGELGKIYSFVYDGTNFILSSGGGGSGKLNVYTGTTQPIKKEGLWIQTNQAVTSIRCELDVWLSGAWSSKSYANPPNNNRSESAAVSVGQYIYVFGGLTVTSSSYRYDTTNNTWSTIASMPDSRYGHTAVAIGHYIYVMGGSAGTGASNTNWRYDTTSNAWTTLNNIPANRYGHTAVTVGNFIYVLAGSSGNSGSGASTISYRYDTVTNSWSTIASTPISTYKHSAAVVGNYIYLFGVSSVGQSYKYDIVTNSWSTVSEVANMPSVYEGRTAIALGQYIYVTGSNSTTSSFHLQYDTVGNVWTQLANPSFSMYNHSAAHINGLIYFFGGHKTSGAPIVVAYALTSTSFPAGTVVIYRVDPSFGQYQTELVTPSKPLLGINNRILAHFDDVYIHDGSTLRSDLPSYYGDGSGWVKIKN